MEKGPKIQKKKKKLGAVAEKLMSRKKRKKENLMKKSFLKLGFVLGICVMMTSCYTVTATIGKGPQTGEKTVGHNHFIIAGLVPVGVANVKEMAGDAKDYQVTVTHSFVDGLLAAITSGIYTPTTTIVKK